MGRELVNEFTWSVSRDRIFRQCKRAYYYQYYGSWGGWEALAPDRTRRIYRLKNLQSMAMWAGGIIHEVIAEALRGHAAKQFPVERDRLLAAGRRKLRNGWLEAVNRDWLASPKKTNLFELYYTEGEGEATRQAERIREKVYGCLSAFSDSAILRELIEASYMNWKPVDLLDSFKFGESGLKVWCAIDFAFFDPLGALRILDWKSGAEYDDELRLQLTCYAIFAQQKWRLPLERLRLAGVFLNEHARVSEYAISVDLQEQAALKIRQSAEAMRELLFDPVSNQAREEDFCMVDNQRVCTRCNFREICPAMNEGGMD